MKVREITSSDIPFILAYWRENSFADLERMGELARPDENANREFMTWFCETRPSVDEAKEDILIWEVDERAIGYATLKDVRPGQDAQIHLHMWDKELRGKGFGSVLFCLSAVTFITKFQLKNLYCQPKSDNPMPNRMLTKIGFPMLETVDWIRADGSIIKQNQYDIQEALATSYLIHQSPFTGHISDNSSLSENYKNIFSKSLKIKA